MTGKDVITFVSSLNGERSGWLGSSVERIIHMTSRHAIDRSNKLETQLSASFCTLND